jgi:hypothetical protein
VIVLPPLLTGADQVTVAWLPGTLAPSAETPVGGPGTSNGVTELDAVDRRLVPSALVAETLNV